MYLIFLEDNDIFTGNIFLKYDHWYFILQA